MGGGREGVHEDRREVWSTGGVEVWRCGGVEVWRCGGCGESAGGRQGVQEVWKYGGFEGGYLDSVEAGVVCLCCENGMMRASRAHVRVLVWVRVWVWCGCGCGSGCTPEPHRS